MSAASGGSPADRVRAAGRASHPGQPEPGADVFPAGVRTCTVTWILVPDAMAKPRTSDGGTGDDAGYQFACPLAMVQPPAVVTCPWSLMMSSWHVVPTGMPVTCALSCVPHGLATYLTVALTRVRGLAARAGEDPGGSRGRDACPEVAAALPACPGEQLPQRRA